MITKKTFFIIWLLGLISGFTIMISGNTLNFWLSKENIDIQTIGIFALTSLPYAINFLWAPIFDIKTIPILSGFFNKRLSWIIFIQFFLIIAVYIMSKFDPSSDLSYVAVCALVISFLTSAQDTVLGALRTELVSRDQQGEVSGIYIFGYRIGMLFSGSFAIYISQYLSWNSVYELFSITIIVFSVSLIYLLNYLKDPKVTLNNIIEYSQSHKSWYDRVKYFITEIIKSIGPVKYIIVILVFLVLYRLPDNFMTMMINPFLLHIGYDEFEISVAGKLLGVSSAIIGGLLASYLMKKINLYNSLLIFGSLHAVAHILFIFQEIYGKNLYSLFLIVSFESISGGMVMTAYIAIIASLCQGRFRATQYAFLSSMMGLSRSILPAISGYIVFSFGWVVFYLFTTIATIPSLLTILYLRKIRVNHNIEQDV